jgi:hypothetical protein
MGVNDAGECGVHVPARPNSRSRVPGSHPGTTHPQGTTKFNGIMYLSRSRASRSQNDPGNGLAQYPCAFPGSRGFSLTERGIVGNDPLYSNTNCRPDIELRGWMVGVGPATTQPGLAGFTGFGSTSKNLTTGPMTHIGTPKVSRQTQSNPVGGNAVPAMPSRRRDPSRGSQSGRLHCGGCAGTPAVIEPAQQASSWNTDNNGEIK